MCWNSQENKVLGLKLSNLGLTSPFPSGLNSCASIQTLDLSDNEFTGAIPSDLSAQMLYLTTLDLSNNWFVRLIPEGLFNSTYLHSLKLSRNQLN
jgi:Leucine-rich repeat (LRR) protein